MLFYLTLGTFINSYFERQTFNIYNVCLLGPNSVEHSFVRISIVSVIPISISIISTIFMDFKVYLWYHKTINPNINSQNNILSDIPLRSSIISTILFIPFLIIYTILALENIKPINQYLWVIILERLNDILRNPLISIFTFQINNENRRRNEDLEREQRRAEVIRRAIIKREERSYRREMQGSNQVGFPTYARGRFLELGLG